MRKLTNAVKMVCAKCQKIVKQTKLATPDVKKKSEMYYGSSAGSSKGATGVKGAGSTLGSTGVSKVCKVMSSIEY